MLSSTIKVCVIGAGPNGLITTRHLSQVNNVHISVFDAGNDIGGLWNYDERNDSESRFSEEAKKDAYYQFHNYFHGTVYQNLTTDVPYFFMGYKDLSHADVIRDHPLFMNMSQHKEYLDAFSSKFDLKKYVTLNTLVVSVRLHENLSVEEQAQAPEKRKFVVKTVSARAGNLCTDPKTHSFDYVIISTGHLSKPNIPDIVGIKKFEGKVLPAKNFRKPDCEFFSQKRVLLVGSSDSAMDILIQLTTTSLPEQELVKKLVLVGRKVGPFLTAEDFKKPRENGMLSVHVGEIAEIMGANTVRLTDGSEHEVDTIVLATGYQFNFPFLDLEKDKLIDFDPTQYRGKFFGPVYKKFIAAREPCLFFMGALDVTPLIYSCYEYHAIILKYIVEGKITLPSKEEMIESFEREIKDMQEKGQVLTNFFNPARFSDDLVYWNDLRRMIKAVRPSDEVKAEAYIQPLFRAFKKLMEFTEKGEILACETHNYYNEFPRELRDTSEFI